MRTKKIIKNYISLIGTTIGIILFSTFIENNHYRLEAKSYEKKIKTSKATTTIKRDRVKKRSKRKKTALPKRKVNNHTMLLQKKEPDETWLTIFVHGIISATPVLSIRTMRQIGKDQVKGTYYQKYVQNVRKDSFFCRNQPMQSLGLQKVDMSRKDAADGSPALAHIFEKQSQWLHKDKKINNYYYTFGWSGLLSYKKRYQDAIKLFKAVYKEVEQFNKRGIKPKVRIVGFSHGASVCINMAKVKRQEKLPCNFFVDEMILLGMPVQANTDYLTFDPLFKRIYNFYSKLDRVQVMDFSAPGKLLSNRLLRNSRKFPLPDSLVQVKFELLRKTTTKKRKDKKRTPRHSVSVRNSSPGHCEWWFFGWTNKFYRKNFGIKPLSLVSIIPTVIHGINETNLKGTKTKLVGNHIKVSVRPYDQIIVLRSKKDRKVAQFLTAQQLEQLKDIAKSFPFKKISDEQYHTKVQEKLNLAQKQFNSEQNKS